MDFSKRIEKMIRDCREKGTNMPENAFYDNVNYYAKNRYAGLDEWERIARSIADAVREQEVYIHPEDRLIGRVYHLNCKKTEDPEIFFPLPMDRRLSLPEGKAFAEKYPYYREWLRFQLVPGVSAGHIAWDWDRMLRLGTEGMKKQCRDGIAGTRDRKSIEFYSGVLIMLTALEDWNDKHVAELERMGMHETAKICQRVPRNPAETFREAVQAFYIQHLVVMEENPFGGNSPGRLDCSLWPYLERDLALGRCTMDEARELITELFLRIDERIHTLDTWVEAIVVGGVKPDGSTAVNPLSYMMIEVIEELNITHPSVYVRLSHNSPEDFVRLCGEYFMKGGNRAQFLNDDAIIKALTESGVPFADAADYFCGGCMEIGIRGKCSDFLYNGYINTVKLAELAVTGGICLKDNVKVNGLHFSPLEEFSSFEDFYREFIGETGRLIKISLEALDAFSAEDALYRPSYLISSMVDNCMQTGRNMHDGGAKYHDYGFTPIGLPNTADYLTAVKKAVFEEKICTSGELVTALQANFEGFEELRRRLAALPKYGQGNAEADDMMASLCGDISRAITSFTTRHGGKGKVVILTFAWAPRAGRILGATAYGQFAGVPVAQGVTPQSSAMTNGLTAAMTSCTKIPFELFNGGASTMWDMDPKWTNASLVTAYLKTFFENGGQIFQGNAVDAELLQRAMDAPEEYPDLIVRVGGYSARFVTLPDKLKKDIVNRYKHSS
ncbi:MAG: pyruvate formate lyase family protein [Eubacteriales bacterium]